MSSSPVLVSALTGRRIGRLVAVLLPAAFVTVALSGCSVVHAVHALETGNKALNNLTKQLQDDQNAKYAVTYETTGSSPSTVQYAADPPTDFAYISPGTNGSGGQEIVQNSSGFYNCSQNSSSSGSSSGAWQCVKISAAQQNSYLGLFQFYTGAYWYTILNAYSSFAAVEGVKITSKSMSVNGFNLNCVVISGSAGSTQNGNGNGTFCVTSQGILGYVASQGSSSVFEIKSYTSSPAPSLFQLPAGATITTLPSGTSGSGGSTTTTTTVAGATGSGVTGSGSGNTGSGSTGSGGNTGSGATGSGGTGTAGNTGSTTTST
jgi:hypothetical protein